MKTYTCIYGKTFDNPQKFNGHKQGCTEHIVSKYGSLDVYYKIKNREAKNNGKKISEAFRIKKEQDTQKWISEQHICERCGKVMNEKFGSGRFCSRACSNSHKKSHESKLKTSESMKRSGMHGAVLTSHMYHTNNHTSLKSRDTIITKCVICNIDLPQEYVNRRKTCSENCKKELFRQNAIANKLGGPSKTSSYGKRGTYRGIHCDSTYELAFLAYCLDNNIKIVRNETSFKYSYQGKVLNYYPDFYLPDKDLFIEIKGRNIGPVEEKLQGVCDAGRQIKILYYEDLKDCFEYLARKYDLTYSVSNNNFYKLYDNNYTSH